MQKDLLRGFCMLDREALTMDGAPDGTLSAARLYDRVSAWAGDARARNPIAFDEVTAWLLDDACWTEDRLAENRKTLMDGVLERFRAQNALLRARLKEIEPSGIVNPSVFGALDAFDAALSGASVRPELRDAVSAMFADFSRMTSRAVREKIAGGRTGMSGTDGVPLFGYINQLKENDACVQWALFMPALAQRQQDGFRIERFAYRSLPAMRFIGREGDDLAEMENRRQLFARLDQMPDCASAFPQDILLTHHEGACVDIAPCHSVWGRFMKAGSPVPEGFTFIDFAPDDDGRAGPPFCARFACAEFAGDAAAMHRHEGYDVNAMYDVTRNIVLGQGARIPYPEKYWTAEVFQDGFARESRGCLFSAMP